MHIHGSEEIDAIIAPNKYRKLYSNNPTKEERDIERKKVLSLMKDEFPEKADLALGIGLCWCFEPILMWNKKGIK